MVKRPLEDSAQIRVLFATVASIPTKVHVEIEEVCEPFANFLFIDPCRCTTRQMSEPIKVDRFGAMRAQVRVQESCVTQFIIVIVGNILGHVAIKILERKFVRRISDVGSAVVGFGGSPEL